MSSLQKYLEQKRGGVPAGDIKNNDAIAAAAAAGRAALKKVGGAIKQEELRLERQRQVRYRNICTCGDPSCRIGPMVQTAIQEY